jgi:hypothetical protein
LEDSITNRLTPECRLIIKWLSHYRLKKSVFVHGSNGQHGFLRKMMEKLHPLREVRVHAGRISNLDFEKTIPIMKEITAWK